MPTDSSVDYAQSLVIPTNFGLRMWINDAERFAHGIVPAREREAVLKRLITFLEADRDEATGRPIISAVFRGDGLYTGPYAENGPDLVIEYNNLYDPAAGTNAARNPHVEGGHTLDGILLAAGPGVQLADVQGASLVDIMPTVLHLLGLEVPPDVDGHVLTQILSSEYMVEHPVRRGETPAQHDRALAEEAYTSEQEEEIRKQLRQLGYL
jgi:predicted AlkP superfamily phosphohydrolase/phosphomutase